MISGTLSLYLSTSIYYEASYEASIISHLFITEQFSQHVCNNNKQFKDKIKGCFYRRNACLYF